MTDSGRTGRGLLDTSTVIRLAAISPEEHLPAEPVISTITLAELSVSPLIARTDAARSARRAHLQQSESDFGPLPFDAATARAFGRVAASVRRAGGPTAARSDDAVTAAVAIANGLPLYTCNPDPFTGIEGLELVAVPTP